MMPGSLRGALPLRIVAQHDPAVSVGCVYEMATNTGGSTYDTPR